MIWHITGLYSRKLFNPKENIMKTTTNPGTAVKTIVLAAISLLFFNPLVYAQPVSSIVKIDTRLCAGTSILDANVVVFDAAYSNAVDGDDAYKFSNAGENIAIQRGTALLVVEGRQPATANDVIPFKIWNLRQQTYRLEFVPNNFANVPMMPLLEDNFLHSTTPISRIAPTSVSFTVGTNAASWASNRFRIVFTAAAPLPVNFISIKGEKNGFGVTVNWKVSGQINVKNYEVERSADGVQFVAVGKVPSISNSSNELNYSFTDNTVTATTCFYRVRSVDNDGKIKYSSIIKVNAAADGKNFTVLSNPVTNNTVTVQFKGQPAGVYKMALLNGAGGTTMKRSISYAGGTSVESFSVSGAVSCGIYWLQITTPANETELHMLVVRNN